MNTSEQLYDGFKKMRTKWWRTLGFEMGQGRRKTPLIDPEDVRAMFDEYDNFIETLLNLNEEMEAKEKKEAIP